MEPVTRSRACVFVTIVGICICLLAGCEKPRAAVQLDPETLHELELFDGMLDEKDRALKMANKYDAHVVPASTDSTATSPVAFPDAVRPSETAFDALPRYTMTDDGDAADPELASTAPSGQSEADNLTAVVPTVDTSTHVEQAGHLETADQAPAHPESRLSRFSGPEEVCREFLDALSSGDHIAASRMLTNVAQIETARASLQLQFPGVEGSRCEVLEAEFATTEKEVAQVRCRLQQPGQDTDVSLTWMMRFQYNGWKIFGMAIRIDDAEAADLLSFENPNDLRRIQSSVTDEEPAAVTAERPVSEVGRPLDR
jgi:hypothetical protein